MVRRKHTVLNVCIKGGEMSIYRNVEVRMFIDCEKREVGVSTISKVYGPFERSPIA